jgi:tetratricopeptide (TPR) repeat protein
MRLSKLSLWIAMVAGVGLITTGCASRYPQTSIQAGFYKRMMERQKAGMAVDPDPLKNLPAMTAGDYETLGDNYLRQDNINMAFVQYNKAINMKPESVGLRYKIGRLFLKKGLPQEAIKEFEAAIAKDPQYALAYEGLGQCHFEMKNLEAAEQALLKAITLDDQLWSAHNLLGIINDRNLKFDEAIKRYQTAIAINNRNGSLYNNLAMSYFYKGSYDQAITAFGNALALSDPQEQKKIYNNVGMTLVKLKRYDQAFEAFKRGSSEAVAHNNMGIVFLQQGKPKEAIASFEKAIESNPSYYAKASENLKMAKMALVQQGAQGESSSFSKEQAVRELRPLRLRLDTMLSTSIPPLP